MTNLNVESLRIYIKKIGTLYQSINCLIYEKEMAIVKGFILLQISEYNGRFLANVRPVRKVLMN